MKIGKGDAQQKNNIIKRLADQAGLNRDDLDSVSNFSLPLPSKRTIDSYQIAIKAYEDYYPEFREKVESGEYQLIDTALDPELGNKNGSSGTLTVIVKNSPLGTAIEASIHCRDMLREYNERKKKLVEEVIK